MGTPPDPAAPDAVRTGAYGLHLPDLLGAAPLLVEAPPDWPSWGVGVEVESAPDLEAQTPALESITSDRAVLRLAGGGWMEAERARARTTLHLDRTPDALAIVHPYFSLSAAVAALWRDDLALHAAAVVHDGGAFGLLGDKGAGKSSTLAALAAAGLGALTDDVLVLHEDRAYAGPRTVDLRTDAAPRHSDAVPLGVVGARDRWRLAPGAVPAVVPIRGWFVLRWGPAVAVRALEALERVEHLLRNLSLRFPPRRPGHLRMLGTLPMWELARPQRAESLPETTARMLELMSS